ncbi:MAG: hypothetical protein KJ070_03975 [Verrucomicrobia bacterium]|nr:hypothetical protein [Verrucomicrobiota bacterium]
MQATIFSKLWMLTLLVIVAGLVHPPAARAQIWGRLANPGFANQHIKATLFFAGQARDGTEAYQPYCGLHNDEPNRTLYPPLDSPHLKWKENEANRHLVLNLMAQAEINVINMSSWGEKYLAPCSWYSAPMQTSPQSHDELFMAAKDKPLLIMPFIETRFKASPTNDPPHSWEIPWQFFNEFPQTPDGNKAPGTVSQIVDLINRYLKNANYPEWAEKWARVFDQNGEQRYAVAIIHAGSNLLGPNDHAAFAAGFDPLADAVFEQTGGATHGGVKVGFFIDALPSDTGAFDIIFKPNPEATGPHLRNQQSLLGIQCFTPEAFTPEAHIRGNNTTAVINWKRDFSRRWFETGIPFLLDVSSGYDAHIAFGTNSPRYGLTPEWLDLLTQMNRDYGRGGMVFNSWNGYSEGMVAVPGVEHRVIDGTVTNCGSLFYDWLRSLQSADVYARKPDAPAPRNGTWASPYTLTEAIQNVPAGGTIGLLPTTSVPFDAAATIQKACTMIAIGGSARIGP